MEEQAAKAKKEKVEMEERAAEAEERAAKVEKNKIDKVERMLRRKVDIDDIIEFTDFSREEIKEIGISIGIDIDKDYNKEDKSF